jgi:hypothetical protein
LSFSQAADQGEEAHAGSNDRRDYLGAHIRNLIQLAARSVNSPDAYDAPHLGALIVR